MRTSRRSNGVGLYDGNSPLYSINRSMYFMSRSPPRFHIQKVSLLSWNIETGTHLPLRLLTRMCNRRSWESFPTMRITAVGQVEE